jgi:hypothetical protein
MKILVTAATIGTMFALVDPAAATIVCASSQGPGPMCKVCSGFVAGVFRDSIPVPGTWTSQMCLVYAKSVGGTQWQLGCMGQNEFHWAAAQATSDTGPAIPAPNCGW